MPPPPPWEALIAFNSDRVQVEFFSQDQNLIVLRQSRDTIIRVKSQKQSITLLEECHRMSQSGIVTLPVRIVLYDVSFAGI